MVDSRITTFAPYGHKKKPDMVLFQKRYGVISKEEQMITEMKANERSIWK